MCKDVEKFNLAPNRGPYYRNKKKSITKEHGNNIINYIQMLSSIILDIHLG